MSVTPIGASDVPVDTTQRFEAAVDSAKSQTSEAQLQDELISNAVSIGGQFIIMPRAQEIFQEAMSSDDEE